MNVLFYNIDISFKVFILTTNQVFALWGLYRDWGLNLFKFYFDGHVGKRNTKKNSSLPLVPLSPSVICMYYVYAPVKTVNHLKGIYSKVYICIDERKYISGSVVYISSTLYLLWNFLKLSG